MGGALPAEVAARKTPVPEIVSEALPVLQPPDAAGQDSSPLQSSTLDTLRKIFDSKRELQGQLDRKIEEMQSTESEESRTLIRKRIQELYARVEDLENDFESIATGLDLLAFSPDTANGFDWQKELQELLRPLLDELKNLTARPREIERLRNEVVYYQKRLALIEKALENIERNVERPADAIKKHDDAE